MKLKILNLFIQYIKDWRVYAFFTLSLILLFISNFNLIITNLMLLTTVLVSIFLFQRIMAKISFRREDLIKKDKEWMYNIILNKLTSFKSSFVEWDILNDLNLNKSIKFRASELGLPFETDISYTFLPPRITENEMKLNKIEDNSSILLGSLLFFPILFTLNEIFRYKDQLAELLIFEIILILSVITISYFSVEIDRDNWGKDLDKMKRELNDIITLGRGYISTLDQYFLNPKIQELSIEAQLSLTDAKESFFGIIYKLLASLPVNQRREAIKIINDEISELPKRQEQLLAKFEGFQYRYLIISSLSFIIFGLFAGIFTLIKGIIIFNLTSNNSSSNIVLLLFILGLIQNLLIYQNWLSSKKFFYLILIWLVLYLIGLNVVNLIT